MNIVFQVTSSIESYCVLHESQISHSLQFNWIVKVNEHTTTSVTKYVCNLHIYIAYPLFLVFIVDVYWCSCGFFYYHLSFKITLKIWQLMHPFCCCEKSSWRGIISIYESHQNYYMTWLVTGIDSTNRFLDFCYSHVWWIKILTLSLLRHPRKC